MSLETNLKVTKLILEDIRSKKKFNANDTKVLRYLISNIHNAAIHKKLGINKDIELPDYVNMSEKFKESWEAVGRPSGNSSLKKIGIHEHVTPLNILIKRMAVECVDENSIFEFVSAHHGLVYITKEEDTALNSAGYQRVLPKVGTRYDAVGIKIYFEPVQYKNFRKSREI